MLLKVGSLLVGLAACVSGSDCEKISARLYDNDRACLKDWQPVGCNPYQGPCPAASTYAVDGTGRCFFFTDLCVPAGFTRVTDLDTRGPSIVEQIADCQ